MKKRKILGLSLIILGLIFLALKPLGNMTGFTIAQNFSNFAQFWLYALGLGLMIFGVVLQLQDLETITEETTSPDEVKDIIQKRDPNVNSFRRKMERKYGKKLKFTGDKRKNRVYSIVEKEYFEEKYPKRRKMIALGKITEHGRLPQEKTTLEREIISKTGYDKLAGQYFKHLILTPHEGQYRTPENPSYSSKRTLKDNEIRDIEVEIFKDAMKEGLVDNNSNAGRVDVNLLKDFGGKYAKLLNDRYSITKGEIGTDESKKRTNTLRIYYQKLAGKIYIHGHPRNL